MTFSTRFTPQRCWRSSRLLAGCRMVRDLHRFKRPATIQATPETCVQHHQKLVPADVMCKQCARHCGIEMTVCRSISSSISVHQLYRLRSIVHGSRQRGIPAPRQHLTTASEAPPSGAGTIPPCLSSPAQGSHWKVMGG